MQNGDSASGESGSILFNTHLIPKADDFDIGSSAVKWKDIYIKGNIYGEGDKVLVSSDRAKKNTITSLSDNYYKMFDDLKPVSYKYNAGTSDRTHIGFIAQDVKEALDKNNLTTKDFAGYCDWEDGDGSITCGLRYSEFTALCVDQIQKLKARVKDLEAIVEELRDKIK